jgi:hypothetical protein
LRNPQPDPPNAQAILNVPGNLKVSLTVAELDRTSTHNDITYPDSIGGSNGAGFCPQAAMTRAVARHIGAVPGWPPLAPGDRLRVWNGRSGHGPCPGWREGARHSQQ